MSNLFRQKSLDRISSPEQLNDYIRVSTPSVWMVLIVIVILLAGMCVWGVFGHMDTTLPVVAVAENGTVTAYVQEADVARITADASVSLDGAQGKVVSISAQPVSVDATFTEYMRYVGGLREGEWVYAVTLDVSCPEGVYAAQIVIDSVSPMSFVLN